MGTDIFGREIKPGTVIAFVSSAAKIDVAVVTGTKLAINGRLIGYTVEYLMSRTTWTPENRIADRTIVTKKKMIRAGRELIAVPASWLAGLQSGQAGQVPQFANRLQYLAEKYKEKKDYEPRFGMQSVINDRMRSSLDKE